MAETDETTASWRGEIWAGFIRTKNWSSELVASRERLVLMGPGNMCYTLLLADVREVAPAIGKFLFWTWPISRAVRIAHSQNEVPAKLVFQAKETPTAVLLQQLKTLGYKVQ